MIESTDAKVHLMYYTPELEDILRPQNQLFRTAAQAGRRPAADPSGRPRRFRGGPPKQSVPVKHSTEPY
jgi:hypothetical protein